MIEIINEDILIEIQYNIEYNKLIRRHDKRRI